jgi:primosomal protein N'
MSRSQSTDGKQCPKCGETALRQATDGTDEVIIEAIFWNRRVVSVKEQDRSLPEMQGQ